MRRDGRALYGGDEELRNNRAVVLEAVKQNGMALEYASERLRRDREVAMARVIEKLSRSMGKS